VTVIDVGCWHVQRVEVLASMTDDEAITDLSSREVRPEDLRVLSLIDPKALGSPALRVAYVAAVRRAEALLASLRFAGEVAVAGPESSGDSLTESAVVQEVALGCSLSSYSAAKDVAVARALASLFPTFRVALGAGEVSERHCAVLVDRTSSVNDREALALIEAKALPKARRMHPGQFRGEVDTLVARFDPDAESRVRRARAERSVFVSPLPDGMAFLGFTHTAPVVHAVYDAITADAKALQMHRGGTAAVRDGDEDATVGACRADALAARVLGERGEDGSVTFDPVEHVDVVVNVVMDLETLRGEVDNAALVDGTPLPAGLAREMVEGASWWRRLVSDPVTGHLLDYGRRTYLPEPLRRYVLARDAQCRRPGCTNRAMSRLQMDHATPFPDGPSDSANCGALCVRCHQLKTAGHADIEDSRPDGSMTWATAFGQRVHVPPRPVLEPRHPLRPPVVDDGSDVSPHSGDAPPDPPDEPPF